jgi:uncharacterized protein YndB with AHSA1/START domain
VSNDSLVIIEGTLHSVDREGVVRLNATYESDVETMWSALTDPQRLAKWYGTVDGDLREGGAFTAVVLASGWDGRGRIDACVPQRKLEVTVWEEEGAEHVVAAELIADGDTTHLALEVRGLPLDFVWAYGAGWQVHLEDLGAHLAGRETLNPPSRWDELEPFYREMTVEPLSGS